MTTHMNARRLRAIINEKNWDQLLKDIKPKQFVRQDSGQLPDVQILAEVCHLLVSETTPDVVKILCLKCLGNSCFDGYKYKRHKSRNTESDKYNKNLYTVLAENDPCKDPTGCDYPHSFHFAYDGVTEWAVDYITAQHTPTNRLSNNELDILRLCIQFLCNLFTYACDNDNSRSSSDDIFGYLNYNSLKQVVSDNVESDYTPLANASCIFVHNALKESRGNYFTDNEKDRMCPLLLKPTKEGFTSSKDSLFHILQRQNAFEVIYSSMSTSKKLDLLEIIYDELRKSTCEAAQSDFNPVLTNDAIEFLALTFCRRSDLILKTVDSYVNGIEPMEVILILDILGLLTSVRRKISEENARRLMINCKYLLMSLHMAGKKSNNYFTPITNLSKVAPNATSGPINSATNSDAPASESTTECEPQEHPAYGFKAGIIKLIGNMVYRNGTCQDLLREIDGIPLLLDCCNIDARNPLILQWTILALRNLCEGNVKNQEIIRNCKKTGTADSPVLQEMGLTLHEDADGQSIRIAPLRKSYESPVSCRTHEREQRSGDPL